MNRPFAIVLLWLVCLIALGGWIWRSIEVEHDLAAFLPDRGRPIETLLVSRANSGAVSRLVFIAFEGGSLERRLAASREAASTLRELDGLEQIANGAGRFDVDAFEPLFAHRYLLADTPSLDQENLRAALETRLRELRSPLGAAAKSKVDSDPTATFRSLLRDWGERNTAPPREDDVWVTDDRERALLLVTIADAGGDLGREAAAVEDMRAVLNVIAERQDVRLLFAGRPALTAEARSSIRASFVSGSLAASALVISLLLWLFRSFGVLLLGILPLASGVLAGLAAVLALFGGIHGIALAFGATLLGVAIDYPLHLFSHHRSGEHLASTARSISRPLLLGALTTSGAFIIFGIGSTPGLGQLACFTAVGIVVAVSVLRLVVPALAEIAGVQPNPRPLRLLPAGAPLVMTWTTVAIASVAVIWLTTREAPLFETDIGALNPLPDAAKQLDRRLRADLGAPDLRYLMLIGGDDAETVLRRSEALAPRLDGAVAAGGLAGFDAPSRYLPSLARQAERQSDLPSNGALTDALVQAMEGLPFKQGLFAPFLEAVEASRTALPLSARAGLKLMADTPLGARLDQLLVGSDGRWYGFLPLSDVTDLAALHQLASATPGAELIDLKALSHDLLSAARKEALGLLALGIAVAMLLLVLLRHPLSAVGRSLAVLVFSLAVTTAFLALIGERITMLHILAALLVVGIGIDYTVFFSWQSADDEQRRRTLQALIACVVSTAMVFGLLALSGINVLRAIGLTVAVGACTTFAIAYAVFSRRHG